MSSASIKEKILSLLRKRAKTTGFIYDLRDVEPNEECTVHNKCGAIRVRHIESDRLGEIFIMYRQNDLDLLPHHLRLYEGFVLDTMDVFINQ